MELTLERFSPDRKQRIAALAKMVAHYS